MKHLMLSAAVAALALSAAPAMAQDESGVKLNLGGHFKGYVNYANQDDIAGSEVRSFDILRDTEVHFGGETTLDNGLTVGAQIEAAADAGDGFELDETYAYFSGTWGRVNFGNEDGAAYLLQVAAPSADENIDGIRSFINPFNSFGVLPAFGATDYANDVAGNSDKVTYLTPVFSGLQAGVSYTPELTELSRGDDGNSFDNDLNGFGDVWEVAARYEGELSGVGFAAGAGYTHASLESEAAPSPLIPVPFTDDYKEWNVGVDANIGAFGLGAVYTENNLAFDGNNDQETWVVGADYTTGPYKLGVSYLNTDFDSADVEIDRYAAGAQYSYGPGMSFRGTVSHGQIDDGTDDSDATAVTVGTQINF